MSEVNYSSTRLPDATHRRTLWIAALLVFLLIPGCVASSSSKGLTPVDLVRVFPAANFLPGWTIVQEAQTYDHDHLFNLVDGQADSFFAYGFEAVAVQRYQNEAGVIVNIEIWQLATPADAYGLFGTTRSGSAVSIGNAGDMDPGRRLAFWQNQYFVSLNASQPVPEDTLNAFAQAIIGVLPGGGEIPDIVNRLPKTNLDDSSSIFFHEEISIQMEVWLGGENILGLSQETNGVLAHYTSGGDSSRLVLVEYPTSGQAADGLKALQNSGISNLVDCDARDTLLGAVIGKVGPSQAKTLLEDALK